jgi:spermidine synthase
MAWPPPNADTVLLETHTDALTSAFHAEEMLVWGKTQWQRYAVARVPGFGKVLFLDGKTQSAELDEYIYHEALVQPAMFVHPNPKRVLICGGGEGATLREVLRHPGVEKAYQIDIDGELIEVAKQHLPEWHQGAYEDPRAEVVIGDARVYLENMEPGTLDVVISDLPDPMEDGPATKLFTREFFALVARALGKDGTFAMQAGSAALTHPDFFLRVTRTVADVFPWTRPCVTHIATYMEPWGFLVAGKSADPLALSAKELDARQAARGVRPRFYIPTAHRALLTPPEYILEGIAAVEAPATDADPVLWTA